MGCCPSKKHEFELSIMEALLIKKHELELYIQKQLYTALLLTNALYYVKKKEYYPQQLFWCMVIFFQFSCHLQAFSMNNINFYCFDINSFLTDIIH